jgi:hypothetical protein
VRIVPAVTLPVFIWRSARAFFSSCPFKVSETIIGEGLNPINEHQHRAADGKNSIWTAKRVKLGISESLSDHLLLNLVHHVKWMTD